MEALVAATAVSLWAAVLAWVPRGLAERPWPTRTVVAAAVLVLVGGLAWAVGPGGAAIRVERALLVETALALAVFDARHLLIPDLYAGAFAAAGLVGPLAPSLVAATAGAFVAAALTAGVRAAAGRALGREALGWGDVKLAAALGAVLGPIGLLWTVAAAAGLGAGVGLALRRRAPEALVPFGAFLAPVGVAVLWARTT